jgi:hypothetical protein
MHDPEGGKKNPEAELTAEMQKSGHNGKIKNRFDDK